ncbi:NACHT domain-containing protein [Nocardiopsis sp. HNM0947]|uniref:NACHT domain-containing protein n=1 Tax=Nocardiopsis coralli TaxID=2772213 RepID=A0ABR9P0U5_9ACTN|nr:NACHT domain-containing protein [Nocardiopsis coralli]MBE2997475.1 NACHT domain-containing protein [Nocardiopsis coralli]
MQDAALKVGTAVVKAACGLWLGNPLAENTATSVVDLIKERVDGVLERRKLERRFAEFEESVAARVTADLEHEFVHLADHEREAAVLAVADAVERAGLTDRVLFEQDLDALYLERYVRAKNPRAVRDLAEPARALYDRVLPDACAYVLATVSALPRFQTGAFTEILRRESLMLGHLEEILERLPRPGTRPVDGGSDAGSEAGFATAYRRKAAERWDVLQLFGTDASTRSYPLSLAYLSLRVTAEREDSPFTDAAHERPSVEQRVEDALGRHRRLFLRGAAGSGKTTLLSWVGVRAGREDFPEPMAAWNGHMPFMVPLRQYVGRPLPEPADFVHHTGRHLANQAPRGWVTGLMERGRAVLLVDGVDELPQGQREEARRWLRDLISDFPDCRYVVTTRPGAAGEDWLGADGFVSAELQPLRDEDVGAFVHHWHEAVRSDTADTAERERLTRYEQELAQKLTEKKHLRAIATTPLLCALLCALYRDQHTALPRDRMEVYDAALRMLLKDRDQQRGIAEGVDLSQKELVLLLQELAKWLVVNGSSDAPVSTAQRTVTRTLTSMHRVEDAPEDVFTYLRVRSGLLQSPSVDRVSFLHRTFEEYLAAKALVEEESFPQLAKNAHDDQWHEVVVMAAGHASPAQREELVRALLERSGEVKKHRDRLLLVAFACLETSPQLARALREEVESRVREILPPRTEDHVRALAMVGESVLPLLADAEPRNVKQSEKIVRAAAEIGGSASIPIIVKALRRPTQRTGLLPSDVYAMNPGREFAESVLTRAEELGYTTLRVEGHQLPFATELMPSVRRLIIEGPSENPIYAHNAPRHLKEVHLSSMKTPWDASHIIRTLPSWATVNTLSVYPGVFVEDLSPLVDTNIESLAHHTPQSTSNLETISLIPHLKRLVLSLHPGNYFSTIEKIIPQEGLDLLYIKSWTHKNLTPLKSRPNSLRSLTIQDFLGSSIYGLESQTDTLEYFTIFSGIDTNKLDLSPLLQFRKLILLSLDSQAGEPNAETLRNIPHLKHIVLRSESPMLAPEWVATLPQNPVITLAYAGAVDLSQLSGAENLTIEITRPRTRILGAHLLGPGSKVVRR